MILAAKCIGIEQCSFLYVLPQEQGAESPEEKRKHNLGSQRAHPSQMQLQTKVTYYGQSFRCRLINAELCIVDKLINSSCSKLEILPEGKESDQSIKAVRLASIDGQHQPGQSISCNIPSLPAFVRGHFDIKKKSVPNLWDEEGSL